MLTMKHIARPQVGESVEYVRPIGSYAVKTKDDYIQFLAYDGLDEFATPSVWGGWRLGEHIANPVVGHIYIMNEAGATVANYRYVANGDEAEPLWPEIPVPPETAKSE